MRGAVGGPVNHRIDETRPRADQDLEVEVSPSVGVELCSASGRPSTARGYSPPRRRRWLRGGEKPLNGRQP